MTAYETNRIEKIRSVINREFDQELTEREALAVEIEERIVKVKKCLKILRYVASYNYYHGNGIKTEDEEYAIHPCVKSLLPCKPEEDISLDEKLNVNNKLIKEEEKPKADYIRGTYKIKHRLVIGNTSKWIPKEVREDEATHKWMVYIRDKDRDADMRTLIKKVRYFLHESYKPHDIIDVTSYPFYLSRRGWGEFPIRVQIHFLHPLNRPLDIIHPLKLDATQSGCQRLGCETVVDVYLVHDGMDVEEKKPKKIKDYIEIEHNYFSHLKEKKTPSNSQSGVNCTFLSDCSKTLVLKNESEIYQLATNMVFFTTEACVRWLLKQWPIVTSSANYLSYKNVHPYSCSSLREFLHYPIGKQRACEWHRAWLVGQMIQKLNLVEWTTREIFLYARMHGWSVDCGVKSFSNKRIFMDINTFTNVLENDTNLRSLENRNEIEDIEIMENVEGHVKKSPEKLEKDNWREENPLILSIIILAKQIGAEFGDEEIIRGVWSNSAVQVIASVLKLFIEDLLRKSCWNSWLRNNLKSPGYVEICDIVKTILETPEFDIFTNVGLGSKMN